jgi:hypothetical protein
MAAKGKKSVSGFWLAITDYYDTGNRTLIGLSLRRNPFIVLIANQQLSILH